MYLGLTSSFGAKVKTTVADVNPEITLRTLSSGNYGRFLVMGNAGFISSTVFLISPKP